MVYACSGEATRTADFQIPAANDKQVQIDDAKPAKLAENKKVSLDSTEKVFGVINTFKSSPATFKGVWASQCSTMLTCRWPVTPQL